MTDSYDWFYNFVEGLYDNPLVRGEFVLMHGNVPVGGISAYPLPESHYGPLHIHLKEIRAFKKGGGRQLMQHLTRRADELGITMSGTVKPLHSDIYKRSWTKKKLMDWYLGFGFKKEDSSHIIRKPKTYMPNPIYGPEWANFEKFKPGVEVVFVRTAYKGSIGRITKQKIVEGDIWFVVQLSERTHAIAAPTDIEVWDVNSTMW